MDENDKELKDLAYKISELLDEFELSDDVIIYFNNKRLQHLTTNKENGWIEEDGYKASDYCEYANDDTITMTFEGPLYEVMNRYNYLSSFHNKFDQLLGINGYYYEMGHAWNLSLAKL